MPDPIRIELLTPQPFADLRRVLLTLHVSGLPAYGPGASSNLLHFPDMPKPLETQSTPSPTMPNVDLFVDRSAPEQATAEDFPAPGDDRLPSPYPDVTLSILDQGGNEIATTFIVEYKESELDFTLHLRTPEPGATYTARAELVINDAVIQTVQVPFELKEMG